MVNPIQQLSLHHQAGTSKVHAGTTRLGETGRRARRRGQGHKRFGMSRIRISVGAVAGNVFGRAVREFEILERPAENLEGCFGLIVRHLVAGLVHSEEREVADLSDLAVLLVVDHEWLVPGRSELGRVRVV